MPLVSRAGDAIREDPVSGGIFLLMSCLTNGALPRGTAIGYRLGLSMPDSTTDKYSAGEQGLGYLYQSRLALLRLLELPENTAVFLEKDDDVDFVDKDGSKSLASLKHKAAGDRLTDLSTDFWKSVRIWMARYKRDGRSASNLRFFLLTTSTVPDNSFLKGFLPTQAGMNDETKTLAEQAEEVLDKTKSDLIGEIAKEFNKLTATEKQDFLARILILDGSPRIEDIPEAIKDRHMRSIRREHRNAVFERLEGWWNDEVIKQLTGHRDGRDLRLRGVGQTLRLSRGIQARQPSHHVPRQGASRRDRHRERLPDLRGATAGDRHFLQPHPQRDPRLLQGI